MIPCTQWPFHRTEKRNREPEGAGRLEKKEKKEKKEEEELC